MRGRTIRLTVGPPKDNLLVILGLPREMSTTWLVERSPAGHDPGLSVVERPECERLDFADGPTARHGAETPSQSLQASPWEGTPWDGGAGCPHDPSL